MSISSDTIQRVKDAVRIEEVVSDYMPLRRRGANLLGLCPFHGEKTPSFTVSPARNAYKCFGCSKSGNSIGFIMEIEKCSFPDAIRKLAQKYHIEIEEEQMSEEQQQKRDDQESMTRVNEFCNKYFQTQLWETEEGRIAGQGYLMQTRQIREDIIRRFQLGYSPEFSNLPTELKKNGFEEKFCVNDPSDLHSIGTGVLCKKNDRTFDRFHGRIIFPFFSASGKILGFAGRIIKKVENVGKYVNSPTSILYEKKHVLYGFYQAKNYIQQKNECILVEGQLDVISMVQAGIENVVSSGGTALTEQHIELIHRFTPNITIIYDGDKAGIKAALRGIDMVLEHGMNVKIVLLPEGQDPDEFARSHTSAELTEYIRENKVDFIQFKTQLVGQELNNDPQKETELMQDLAHTISIIPEIITRQTYIHMCASMLKYEEQVLRIKVNELRRDQKNTEMKKENIVRPEKKKEFNRSTMLDDNYRNLIQLIVRYGEMDLYCMADGTIVSVGEYIISKIQELGCIAPTLTYEMIMSEFTAHSHDEGFKAEDYYKYHIDPEISQLAISLIMDPYDTKTDAIDLNRLPETVEKMLNELRYTQANMMLDDTNRQMVEAQQAQDADRLRKLIAHRTQLMIYKQQIGQLLGR